MYKVIVGKHVVFCETTEEVAQLLERFKKEAALDERGSPWTSLLNVLSVLRGRGSRGLTSEDVTHLAGLRGARGLSPKLRLWSSVLAEHGLAMEDVVVRYRMDGSRRWRAGPKIGEAIRLAERFA